MDLLADAHAAKSDSVLRQHQAALSLLQSLLIVPGLGCLHWLDLACGRGQIIRHLDDALNDLSKLHFRGLDAEQEYVRETKAIGDGLKLASCETTVCLLRSSREAFRDIEFFDFITLTNTIHEVFPPEIPELLVDCVLRLSSGGTLYVHDMEKLNQSELGAVTWRHDEIREIMTAMMTAFGSDFVPAVQRFTYTKTTGWQLTLERKNIGVSSTDLSARRSEAIMSVSKALERLLEVRKLECEESLELMTKADSSSPDREELMDAFHSLWALTRALKVRQ